MTVKSKATHPSPVHIPDYIVEVRHPKHGWSVVGVSHDLNKADAIYDNYVEAHPEMSAHVKKVDPDVAQCWQVVRDHRGSE